MNTTVQLIESLHDAVSRVVLGSPSRKAELLAQLEYHRKIVSVALAFLYLFAVVVAAGAIMLGLTNPAPLMKGLLPYAGGAAFVALLEFARRLTREWQLIVLPLAIAPHVSDSELAMFLRQLLGGLGRRSNVGGESEKKTSTPLKRPRKAPLTR